MPVRSSSAARSALTPIFVAAVLALVAMGTGWWSGQNADARSVLIARYTARVSLALFLLVYVSGPLARGWPNPTTRRLEARWRQWVIAFLVAHLVHFATMIQVFASRSEPVGRAALLFGPVAYLLPLTLLAALPRSDHGWRGWLRVGTLNFVWLSFAVTYWHRLFVAPDRRAAGVFAFAILLAGLAIRLAAALRTGHWLTRD